jgi:hypothetical protein
MIVMKKVMMTIAGMLFIGVVAVQAQSQDTTTLPRQDTTVVPEPAPTTPETQPEQEKQEGSYMLRDMTALQASEIPATLRESLQSNSQYKGWDDPTTKIYRNKTSDLYVVQIMDGTETKSYRFDRNGKPIEK